MSRTGHRRAAVLLCLGEQPKRMSVLMRETHLKHAAVEAIIDSLCMSNLAAPHPDGGYVLGTGNVAEAVAEAQAILEARAREVVEG